MRKLRSLFVLALGAMVGVADVAAAQGVTTGAISGLVADESGKPIDGALIQVENKSNGFKASTLTRENGRYYVQGLEVGGPYTVSVRRLGFAQQAQDGVLVKLGQTVPVDFVVKAQAAQLAGVTVSATKGAIISPTKMGVSTTISDTAIARFPSLNRDFTDFARATPQVSTTGNGLSGGGVNNRYNLIQIDGANESDLFGLGSNGRPGDQAGAKSISLDAVKEYQVLLSPFDVRQGNFSGLLINAVTKSGTNNFHGSVFGYTRDQDLTRKQPFLGAFSRSQYGASIGGPIVRNKAFFFLSTEWQKEQLLSTGPYIGSSDSPVSQTQVDAFNTVLAPLGIAGGTGAQINRPNPLTNVFARVDLNFLPKTRVVVRHNYGAADNNNFGGGGSRDAITNNQPSFALTSNAYAFTSRKNATVVQAFTALGNGVLNELNVGYTTINDKRDPVTKLAQISVVTPRQTGTGTALFIAGGEASSHGNQLDQKTLELADNLTIPIGDHNVTIGTKNIFYQSANLFANNLFGTWRFNSLDSLRGTCATCGGNALASSYAVTVPTPAGTDGFIRMKSATYAFYVQDQWNVRPTINFTYGIRADIPVFRNKPVYNLAVDTAYKRNTSDLPTGNIQWSPRIGFNWDVTGDQRNQLRGGVGGFTGSPAGVWLSNAYGNTGLLGTPGLTCNNATPSNANYPPTFTSAAIANPPVRCGGTNANPASAALSSTINTIDPNMKFPQVIKYSLGFDHDFGRNIIGSVEGLYTRSKYSLFYSNLALAGPQGTDAHGRTMYGTITGSSSSPVTKGGRNQVYDASNSSGGDYSYNLTASLIKRFADNWEGALSYTYSEARDVQSTLNSTANSNFNQGRTVSGDLLDKTTLAPAKWDQPHKIAAAGTYSFPWRMDVSLIYTGTSGSAYDYYHSTDENADGSTANDLVYIPKNTADANEILFTGYNVPASAASVTAQQVAMDKFINSVDCLKNQRGQILKRMTCRAPWRDLYNVSIRQSLPSVSDHSMSFAIDIFNFANLVNSRWGQQKSTVSPGLPGVQLLSRTGVTTQSGKTVGVYTFSPTQTLYDVRNVDSNYRIQLSLRYGF
ncbi:MAG: TonB-dependent receptor [Gemmatimonadaceae bacterium]|nr:TonB-dependent receptor [Gemmatimonadaceae bacterium]